MQTRAMRITLMGFGDLDDVVYVVVCGGVVVCAKEMPVL
jgi:hypothetical protein